TSSDLFLDSITKAPPPRLAPNEINIPFDTGDDNIKNYVEVICGLDVTSLHRQRNCPSVAVVQFETNITDQDIIAWEKRLEEKRLCENRVTIQALGQPNGVIVYNVPHDVTDELLELYFENKRSGGLDGCVIDVVNKAKGIYVVKINIQSAIKSILSNGGHNIKGVKVTVEPWFETLNRQLLRTENDRVAVKQVISTPPCRETDPVSDRVTRKPVISTPPCRETDIPVRVHPFMFGSRESRNVDRVLPMKHSQSYEGNQIFTDTDIGQERHINTFKPTSSDPESRRGNENLGRVKASSRGRQFSQEQQRERRDLWGQKKYCRSEISLPPHKIKLLIINRFGYKMNSETVNCSMTEKAGKVTLCATSDEELKSVEIKLYECLSRVSCKEKIIQAELAQFLNTVECEVEMNNKLRSAKIPAAFEIQTDINVNKIVMHAFIANQLEIGLDFIDDCVKVKELALPKGIKKNVLQMTVTELTPVNDTTKVYLTSSNIFVCSFCEKQAEHLAKTLLKEIKNIEPKKVGRVELSRAKARCFKKCYLQNIEAAFRWTEEGHGTDYKLVVHIEGEDDDLKFVKSMINKIGSEIFNFKRVCTDDADNWLLMAGLNGRSGHDFLKSCEERFNCWLDVSKDGDVIPPTKGRSRLSVDSESEEVALQAALQLSLEASGELLPGDGLYGSNALEDLTQFDIGPRNLQQSFQTSATVRPYSVNLSGVKVVIKKGEIVKENADVLVNILSPGMQLAESIVSKAFLNACGQSLLLEFSSATKTSVITTSGCGLACKTILHVGLKKGNGGENCVSEVMQLILDSSEHLQYQSLAMPPLGVGRLYNYPMQSIASQMFQVMSDHFQQGTTLKNVIVMAYDKSTFDELIVALVQIQSSAPSSRRHISSPTISTPQPSKPILKSRQPTVTNDQKERTRARSHESERRRRQYSIKPTKPKRIPDYSKTDRITITVFAESKDECIKAIQQISKTMRAELLFEEKFDTVEHISKETKDSIVKIISKYSIRSIKESMAHEEVNIPIYWKLYKGNTPFSEILSIFSATGKDYNKIAIDAHDPTYSRIVKMVNKTFDSTKIGHGQDAKGLERLSYSKLWITNIQRIENPQLFRKYVHKRQEIFLNLLNEKRGCWPTVGQLPRSSGEITTRSYLSQTMEKEPYSEINEVYLFHGTKPDTIQTICITGLDPRLGSGKAMFGSGIYGAEKSSKADQYTDDISTRTGGAGNEKKMFLMRVILGKSYLCTDPNPHKYKRPPCTQCYKDDCKIHDSNFHSVVGDNNKLFREFVVYEGVQCYPEYLITYERR
ncbi:PAR14-like protein, partial [Mya arenaria]